MSTRGLPRSTSDPAFNIFYDAPALVIVYARPSTPYAVGDCSMAAYTPMLTAHDSGLATCWIGFAVGRRRRRSGRPPRHAATPRR